MGDAKKRRITKSQKEYIPREGSGAYAILITLYKKSLEHVDNLTKSKLISEGQHLANASFTKPDPGSRYTAWSSMGMLTSKNLVTKKSNPAKFSLTQEGMVLARKLLDNQTSAELRSNTSSSIEFENSQSRKNNLEDELVCINLSNEVISLSQQSSSSGHSRVADGKTNSSTQPVTSRIQSKAFQKQVSNSSTVSSQEDTVIFSPDTFDIILYVDTCETGGSNIDIHDDPILSKLRLLPVKYEVRSLKVGDYIWICRDRATNKELVLPFIIERKRMDDFAKSIKDGRYSEQKFRLKRSGIQNITYLVEKYSNNQFIDLPLTTLHQATTNTAIQDGFCIKFTDSCKHTAKYLANFSLLMIKMFQSKTLVSCPKENLTDISLDDDLILLMSFKEFNQSSIKNKPMKVSDLFIKVLIQIKGMSVDKALAIIKEFPTPAALREAYAHNPGVKGEKLLAQTKLGDSQTNIGQALSKTVYQLFTQQNF